MRVHRHEQQSLRSVGHGRIPRCHVDVGEARFFESLRESGGGHAHGGVVGHARKVLGIDEGLVWRNESEQFNAEVAFQDVAQLNQHLNFAVHIFVQVVVGCEEFGCFAPVIVEYAWAVIHPMVPSGKEKVVAGFLPQPIAVLVVGADAIFPEGEILTQVAFRLSLKFTAFVGVEGQNGFWGFFGVVLHCPELHGMPMGLRKKHQHGHYACYPQDVFYPLVHLNFTIFCEQPATHSR